MVKVKGELTELQKAILAQLTVEKKSVKEIARLRDVSQQSIYAQIRTIISKGWLKKSYSANFVKVE